jgi:hypothetical protein
MSYQDLSHSMLLSYHINGANDDFISDPISRIAGFGSEISLEIDNSGSLKTSY